MEDAHAAVLDLQAENGDEEFKAASVDDRLSFWGIRWPWRRQGRAVRRREHTQDPLKAGSIQKEGFRTSSERWIPCYG